MNFKEREMYDAVMKSLRRRFPKRKGWKIHQQPKGSGYTPDFVVERKVRDQIHRVVVEVKAEKRITQDHVNQVNNYARNLAGSKVRIKGKILFVPSGADTSVVPDDITVVNLKQFKQ